MPEHTLEYWLPILKNQIKRCMEEKKLTIDEAFKFLIADAKQNVIDFYTLAVSELKKEL